MKTVTILSMVSFFKALCCMGPGHDSLAESFDAVLYYIDEDKIPMTRENRKKIQKVFLEESKKIEAELSKKIDTNPILFDEKKMSEITYANLFPEKKKD